VKKIYKLNYVFLLVAVILLITGFHRAYVYSSFYEDEVDTVIKQPDTHFALWNITEIKENDINTKFFLLSGVSTVGTMENGMNSIDINSTVKIGKVKVLLLNEKDEIVFFKEIGDENLNLEVDSGIYKIILIGKWFIGNVAFKTSVD